ncbi:hypothetical protein VP01_3314g2 [Puccinia sorghi]|uniref:Uncharacterized protein n=1 Tax=Puccinia sorghi TaxID=27349 RepID=A0A0L6UXE8_9BASI|nr:hypothetical protein VP01_3314g2 [Puccinia sorghi]
MKERVKISTESILILQKYSPKQPTRERKSQTTLSQYAPILARLHHQRLNELQESSGKSNEDCAFGRLNQDSKAVEANYNHNSIVVIRWSTGNECEFQADPLLNYCGRDLTGCEKKHSTQSLEGIPPPPSDFRGLNSIFDVAPETDSPSTTHAQKQPVASPHLNPSAKGFTFSSSKLSPVTRSCPTSSIFQQQVRVYSQSTSPSAIASTTQLLDQDNTGLAFQIAQGSRITQGIKACGQWLLVSHPQRVAPLQIILER